MKKLFFVAITFIGVAILCGFSALIACDSDFSQLVNYGNYTENVETFTQTNIVIKDCENIEINNETRSSEIEIKYFTNSKQSYKINSVDDTIYIEGLIEDSFLDNWYSKGIEISIPNTITASISIDVEDCEIEIEDVTLTNLNIIAEDSKIDISNCIVNKLTMDLEDCKVEVDDVDAVLFTINADDCKIEIEFPRRKTEYNLDINVKGSCNISSNNSQDLLYTFSITATDSKVVVEFN